MENRIFGLDVLRALAILVVVYTHGYYILGNSSILNAIGKVSIPIDGVTLFFVLSGFLIGRILLRMVSEKNFSGKILFEFWARRWFRTLPNYFLILIFLTILFYIDGTNIGLSVFLKYAFFLQNVVSPHPPFFSEAWSLSVEEWFYFFVPIPLCMFIKFNHHNHQKIIFYWILTIIISSTFFRIYQVMHLTDMSMLNLDLNIRKEVITRLDSLMYGVFGAYLSLYQKEKWNYLATPFFIFGLLIIFYLSPLLSSIFGEFYATNIAFTLGPMSVLFLLPKLSSWKKNSGIIVTLVTFISSVSYSMYLIHHSLIEFYIIPKIMKFTPAFLIGTEFQLVVQYIIYWVLTIGGAFILYKYFEKPMTALREKFNFREFELKSLTLRSSSSGIE